jgi:sugar lactone lactonase YvrE
LKARQAGTGRIRVKCGTWKISGLLLLVAVAIQHPLWAQNVTTLAPPQPTNFSGDLSVDANGDIFVADFGILLNNANGTRVWKVTPGGQYSIFAQGFSGASGNTFDAQGNLFQSNIAASRVDMVTPAGARSAFATSGAGISNPVGLTHDAAGNLYVANCGNNTIRMITPQSVSSTFSSALQLNCPNGLTIDDDDTLYAANFGNGAIVKMPQGGGASVLARTPGSSSKPGGGNGHIIFGNDRLYVVSNATHQVFELLLDGTLNLIAGSGMRGRADGPLLQAQFSLPNGIDLSPDGRTIYVNDSEGLQNNNDIAPNVIRVIPLPNIEPEFSINSGLNDAWFNPATSGQGFFITVFENIGMMFVAWFTYDTTRPDAGVTANLGEPGHRWLTAFGPYEGDTASLDIEVTSGGVFDAAQPMPGQQTDGTLEIVFADCENGLLNYEIDSLSLQGSIPLSRIALDNVPACERSMAQAR